MAQATFGQDAFTDTSGTALASHVPTVGTSWIKHASYSGLEVISSANRVRNANTIAEAVYYIADTPANSTYDVSLDLVTQSSDDGSLGVLARVNTGAKTFYRATYTFGASLGDTGTIYLDKVVANVSTSLGTYACGELLGTNTLKLSVTPLGQVVSLNGTNRITTSDTAIGAVGQAGIYSFNLSTDGNAIGRHGDSLLATYLLPNAIADHYVRKLDAVRRSFTW